MKKVIYVVLSSMAMFTPTFAFAVVNFSVLLDLETQGGQIIAKVIPIVFALAIIYFFWGIVQYIRGAGDPAKASEGKSIMIYGVIAIAVMVSLYGLVTWLQDTLGINTTATIILPIVPGLGV